MSPREEIVFRYIRGDSGLKVARDVGLSFGLVYHVLRLEGVPCRSRESYNRPKPPKPPLPPTVQERILSYLGAHPGATGPEIAAGIGHPNRMTVASNLSRFRVEGTVVAATGGKFKRWSLPPAVAVAGV
jgi:hypothetical protein